MARSKSAHAGPNRNGAHHDNALDNRYNITASASAWSAISTINIPRHAQLHSLEKLVAYLMKTYHIPPSHVLGHNDCKATDCPGRNLNVASVREQAERLVADGNIDFNANYADQR